MEKYIPSWKINPHTNEQYPQFDLEREKEAVFQLMLKKQVRIEKILLMPLLVYAVNRGLDFGLWSQHNARSIENSFAHYEDMLSEAKQSKFAPRVQVYYRQKAKAYGTA
jgi:hypothetical protein